MLHNQLDPSAYGHGFQNYHRNEGGAVAFRGLLERFRRAAVQTAAALGSLRRGAAVKPAACK